jgi:hypothetical protein
LQYYFGIDLLDSRTLGNTRSDTSVGIAQQCYTDGYSPLALTVEELSVLTENAARNEVPDFLG